MTKQNQNIIDLLKAKKDKPCKTRNDYTLLKFIRECGVEELVKNTAKNRGQAFESCITLKAWKHGTKGVSNGDIVINGERIEIKYLTIQTGASEQENGTLANRYLMAFNNSYEIMLRLINKSDIVVIPDKGRAKGKITYQNNIDKGQEITLEDFLKGNF